MPDALDTQAVEHTARELLDTRITAVRELAKAQVAVDQARDALGAAEANHVAVHVAATRVGWSDAELRQMGLATPKRRAPGRPRRARGGGPRSSSPPAGEMSAASAGGDAERGANGG